MFNEAIEQEIEKRARASLGSQHALPSAEHVELLVQHQCERMAEMLADLLDKLYGESLNRELFHRELHKMRKKSAGESEHSPRAGSPPNSF